MVIFSKSYCPYCHATKQLFQNTPQAHDVKVVELNVDKHGAVLQRALLQITGQRTVPNVFINAKHVGGNDDVTALHYSQKLQSML